MTLRQRRLSRKQPNMTEVAIKNMGSGNTATVEDAIASSQKPRFGLPARVLRRLMIPAALVLIVAITCMAVRLADQNLRLNLLQQARLVAKAIDMKHVQVLSGTKADLGSPDYQRLKEQLGSIRSANAQCRFLYLLGRQPDGKVVFFVDSEPSDSKDYSPPGQLFEESTADLLRMFETKVPFVEGPVTDSWGTWVSALVPLTDPKTGTLVAVLGMDIDAHLWTWDVAARVALPVGLLLVILIGMASVYLATRLVGRDRTGRHRDFEPKPVLRRLMPPLAAMVSLLLTGAGVGLYWQHRQQMARDIAAVTADVSNDLRMALIQQAADLTDAAQTIAADTTGRKALRASDGSRLLALWQPVFETLRREKHISHLCFLDTRRVCLLRLHKPDKKGDRIERFTALEAERTGKSATGIELGQMGTFTLRTVLPVCEDGALVGYVELGKEIADTLQEMHPRTGVQMAVSIRKEHLSQQTWEEGMRMLGRDSDWNRLPRSVLIFASQGRLPDVFAPMADHDESGRHTRGDPDRQLAFAGRDWRVSALPLTDVSGKEVGDILVMCDITDGLTAFAHLVILGGTVGGVLLALLLGFVYVLLRQTDRLIRYQERELRESEESYRNQFVNNSAVMLLIDPSDGTIIDANTAASDFYGYPRERLLTMRITDINTLPMAEALQTMAAVHENVGQRLQAQHRLADGSVRQVETSISRIQFGGRTVLHAIIHDITEQQQADESLRENHDMIVKLTAQVPGVVYQYRLYPDGRSCFPFSSPGMKAIYEVNPEEVRKDATPVFGRLHPDDHDRIAAAIHESARSLQPFHCEFRVVLPEQGLRWRLSDALPERTADGGTLWHGIISDITERKQAETYRDMSMQVLQILNRPDGLYESVRSVLAFMKTQTGADAVGLRLQDGEDFPYFAQQGFSEDFLLTENSLAERGADGGVCRDKDGKVCLECTCGLVISGKTDPSHPLFTRGGSCWMNDSAPLLDLPPAQDPRHHPRNECIHQGYASVALIPVRATDRIVGLLHLNACRKGCFTLDAVSSLEALAAHIGEALMRKQAKESLKESEQRYRSLFYGMTEGFAIHELILDKQGIPCDYRFLTVNPAFERLTGLKAENLVGKSQRQVMPGESLFWLETYSKVVLTGEPAHVEHYSTIMQRHFSVYAYSPAPNQFATIISDITEHKRFEDVQTFLAQTGGGGESEPFFNALARYLAQSLNMDFVCIDRLEGDGLNARTVAVWCDGRFEDNVTYALKDTPCGDVVGKQVCCFPASVCQFFPRDQVLKDLRAESYVGVTLFGHTGKPVGLIAVIGRGPLSNRPLAEAVLKLVAFRAAGEIERQDAELELHIIDKLQSVGTLAGGIAHDFNNILLGLFGNISIAMEDLAKEHPSYAPLAGAEKSMTRAVRLTKQLLTFAKGGDPVKEHIGLADMVEEVARFDLTGSNVSLVYHHDADLWPVDADRGQIQQVVSNLVINARQAMPCGGHLHITLENADLPAEAIPGLSAGRYVKVIVQDEGGGIEQKVLDRIFDPYFSTKQTGSGLGLATVWSITNKHGGHIGVESEVSKGATFTFYLPASSSRLSVEEESPSAEIPSQASPAKILVMDDEVMVCDLASKMLPRYGYTVATAPDGQEAIVLYRQALDAGAPFDLVIMDLTIPGGPGGKEVIKDLLALDPDIRAIVSSGYADDPVMANPAKYGFKGTVAKPYTARALREAVALVMK